MNTVFRIVATLTGAGVGWLLDGLGGLLAGAAIGLAAGWLVIRFGEKEGE